MGRGDWHDPHLADVRFDDWASRWLAIKTPQLAPSTVVLYRYLLRNHILPEPGPMPVGRIKVEAGVICPQDGLKVRLAQALGVPTGDLFPWPNRNVERPPTRPTLANSEAPDARLNLSQLIVLDSSEVPTPDDV